MWEVQLNGSWVLINKVYDVSHLKSKSTRRIHQHPQPAPPPLAAGPRGRCWRESRMCRQPLLKSLSHTVYSSPSVAHLNERISKCFMIIQTFFSRRFAEPTRFIRRLAHFILAPRAAPAALTAAMPRDTVLSPSSQSTSHTHTHTLTHTHTHRHTHIRRQAGRARTLVHRGKARSKTSQT